MSSSESGPGSNFGINLASSFGPTFSEYKSESNSESESDLSSVFMNLGICVFLPYIYILLNKLEDDFFINPHNRINSYGSNTSIISIILFSFGTSLPKKFVFITPSNSLTLAFKYLYS